MGITRFWINLFGEISIIKVLRKYQQRKMRRAILDDENVSSERSLLLERSITPRSIIRNEYAASELSGDGKGGVDICHIMEEEESIAGDDQVCLYSRGSLQIIYFDRSSSIMKNATTKATTENIKIGKTRRKMPLMRSLSQVEIDLQQITCPKRNLTDILLHHQV